MRTFNRREGITAAAASIAASASARRAFAEEQVPYSTGATRQKIFVDNAAGLYGSSLAAER